MTAVAAYADATVGFIKRDVTGFLGNVASSLNATGTNEIGANIHYIRSSAPLYPDSLAAFTAQDGYEDDGQGSARTWLRWQTRVTKDRPVDATIMAIVDAIEHDGRTTYEK